MACQLFPLVFPISLKIKYSKLKSDQLEHLEQELVNQSKCLHSSPISRYITNSDVMQLIQQINNINLEAEESFWLKLAELGEKGSFKKWSTFGGLCEVMLEIAERRSVQNLYYFEKYSDFIAILSSLSTCAYNNAFQKI
ncbi:12360_t:CDS:2 [Entrophospora sp. SA101]|nr:3736_t:CDS:2 [Entrophospora sp. SA101]CAJ0838170.1 12360_t:CDS:2 [Entrophospora sp. SA101]